MRYRKQRGARGRPSSRARCSWAFSSSCSEARLLAAEVGEVRIDLEPVPIEEVLLVDLVPIEVPEVLVLLWDARLHEEEDVAIEEHRVHRRLEVLGHRARVLFHDDARCERRL